MARINRGRCKIQMKRISSTNARQATFSKRRVGLFKKASELCILTGAEVSIIVFSEGGKPFSFGHPSVNEITSRFSNATQLFDSEYKGSSEGDIPSLYNYNYLRERIDFEKKRGQELDRKWTQLVDGLNLDQLKMIKSNLLNSYEKITEQLEELLRMAPFPTPNANPKPLTDLNVP